MKEIYNHKILTVLKTQENGVFSMNVSNIGNELTEILHL